VQPLGGASEVQFLGHGNKTAELAELEHRFKTCID
jgi:hypothetical protein